MRPQLQISGCTLRSRRDGRGLSHRVHAAAAHCKEIIIIMASLRLSLTGCLGCAGGCVRESLCRRPCLAMAISAAVRAIESGTQEMMMRFSHRQEQYVAKVGWFWKRIFWCRIMDAPQHCFVLVSKGSSYFCMGHLHHLSQPQSFRWNNLWWHHRVAALSASRVYVVGSDSSRSAWRLLCSGCA